MWLTSSSVGRKLIMALTGAFLVLFVTFHAVMNGVAIFWPAAYNAVCQFLGANWYALIGTVIIAAAVVVHILYALWLTIQNRRARGNERYAVTSRPPQVEWASKNMLVLGIVVLAFLAVHLMQFWYKMQFAEVFHQEVLDNGQTVPAAAGTWFLQMAFSQPWTLVVYLIGFAALWFHLTHGFWSMMQTVGWNNDTWMRRIKCIGNLWITCVILLFAAEAIVFTVQAHRGVYTSCPRLLDQYEEMLKEHNAEVIPCVAFDQAGTVEEAPCQGCQEGATCPQTNEPCTGEHHCGADNAAPCQGDAQCPHHADGACPHAAAQLENQESTETANN